ncbi:glycoside hydrolase family 30 beta sandwich domain-containing protein [Sphingomonas bacterium]|uniref:glycoside hydrolase family 30 beta sandwich domain-containing protein n=1 Tax=Sphingomonas bacterium TaxID=1895847 RepID=UPI001576E177|nr:glycoside hydrolase family 30 beta sandwich domain-containing protein [Sphingomonas bacterium]
MLAPVDQASFAELVARFNAQLDRWNEFGGSGMTSAGALALAEALPAEINAADTQLLGIVTDAGTGLRTLKRFTADLATGTGGGVTIPDPGRIAITGLRTAGNLSQRLASVTPAGMIYRANPAADRIVDIDAGTTYQAFLGVGAALTESACYELMTQMTLAQRTSILTEWLVTNGGSLARVCVGPSDFCVDAIAVRAGTGNFHTYDDSGSTDGSGFDFSPALIYVIPILQLVRSIKPTVEFIGSFWTPPVQYKSPGATLTTGTMNEATVNLTAYATNYIVKALQAFKTNGAALDYICLQNEPGRAGLGNDVSNPFPACEYTVPGYVALFGITGAAIAAATSPTVETQLLAGDDSVSTAYVSAVFADDTAAAYAAGSTVHGYNESLYNFPNHLGGGAGLPWIMSEISSYTDDAPLDASNFLSGIVTPSFRSGAAGVLVWNAFLDPAGQPGIASDVPSMIVVAGSGAVTRSIDYYVMAHYGRTLKRGALRIDSTTFAASTEYASTGSDIETVAWKNPDGTLVVFVWNGSTSPKLVYLRDVLGGGVGTSVTIPARTFDTYTFRNSPAANKPDAPRIAATFNSGVASVTLKGKPPCDNGAAITGYDIYIGAQGGTTGTRKAANVALPAAIATDITTPYVYAQAINSAGDSANSNEVAATSTDTTQLGLVQEAGAAGDANTAPSISLAAPAGGGNTIVVYYTGDIDMAGPAGATKIGPFNDATGIFICAWIVPAYLLAGGRDFTPIGGTPFGWTMAAQEYRNFTDLVPSTHGVAHLFETVAYWQTAQPRPGPHYSTIAVGWNTGGVGTATAQVGGGPQGTAGVVTIASGAGGLSGGVRYHGGIIFRKPNAMGGEDYANVTATVNLSNCGLVEFLAT